MSDLSWLEKAAGIAGALGIGGFLTYLGTRYTANKGSESSLAMAEVENRRTNLEQIKLILDRHDREISTLRDELKTARAEVQKARSLLRLALQHIGLLRKALRDSQIEPPPLPASLNNDALPWDIEMYET